MRTSRSLPGIMILILALQIQFSQIVLSQNKQWDSEQLLAPLPELFQSLGGESIETLEKWEELRRPEILELFRAHVYGRVPDAPVSVNYRLKYDNERALDGKAIMKEVEIEVLGASDSLSMNLLIFLPADQKGPFPMFLGLNFNGNHTIHPDPGISVTDSWVRNNRDLGIKDHRARESSRGAASSRWPVEYILSRGFGLATMYYGDIDPDYDDDFKNGIHKLMDGERNDESWGSIAAWAWGLSRAMDYFETDAMIDTGRVAVIGHSRLGKTSLWAGAQDERFAMVVSNNSGCGGAALSLRAHGETVGRINQSFPHWFNERFNEYNGKEALLPLDQHMLMALIAPRALYVASAKQDDWADPKGEFLSLYHGSQTYRLYGEDPLSEKNMPELNEPVKAGRVAYHIRSGKHDVTQYDWEQYVDFAEKQMPLVKGKKENNPVSRAWVEKHLYRASPRLILTPDLEHRIWQQLDSGDTMVSRGMELLIRNADSMLELDPLVRTMKGRRLLGVSREAVRRLSTLALAYRFDRDEQKLHRLEAELRAVCSFSDWNPSHFLDVAEMAAGVALALDWSGEWLSPEVQDMAKYALVNKALKPGLPMEGGNWWISTDNNWNLVCHGGLSLAALTVYEDEPELATSILHQAVGHIPLALKPYAPEGVYPEGASYWFYATSYLCTVLSAYETALGTDFGFSQSPGLEESAVFSQVLAGPSGEYYNFFDSGLSGFHHLTHFGLLAWFAHRFGGGLDWDSYASVLKAKLESTNIQSGTRLYPVHFLNLARLERQDCEIFEWPASWSGGGSEPVVIMRDRVNTKDAFFLAAKGGRAADNHGNMDAGSFVFELNGVRWSIDPGNQDYNTLEQIMGGGLWSSALDSPRWSLLTKHSGGHSTLQINNAKHLADARARLIRRELRDEWPEFSFDLTEVFGTRVKKVIRTFKRISESRLRIVDEVLFSPETRTLTWQLITRAEVKLSEKGVVLEQEGKSLFLSLPGDVSGGVKVVSLSPPPLSYDKNIEGLKRLEIQWNRESFAGDSATLIVELDSVLP